ncbi:MAG: hypothetical protein HY856_18700 [Burkholderiales bacterium]|jgi:hypothetical protein|nr:hypothetical protein [Burkholderiales bacterium]
MQRDTSPDPSASGPVTDDALSERGTEQGVDRIDEGLPVDADWRQREATPSGHPPPDDGDNDQSPYGDVDRVRDEGVAESLGKSISEPVLGSKDVRPDPSDA